MTDFRDCPDREECLADMRWRIEEPELEIKRLQEQLARKDNRISNLLKELNRQDLVIADLHKDLSEAGRAA